MTDIQKKTASKTFAEIWKNKGYEKGESQSFWLSLLRDVLGAEHPEQIIEFETPVKDIHTNFIDGWIDSTKVLIEQKSSTVDLRKPIKQSDGTSLTPFQQALKYNNSRPYSKKARWIITCNFQEFLIYDMEKPNGEPSSILLTNLPKEYYRLQFLTDTGSELIRKETEISIKAGDLVGMLYDEILKQYKNPNDENTLKSLNMLCVRLVFCLYAEDSGLFGDHLKFHNYLKSFAIKDVRRAIIDLFKVLDTKIEDRDPYLDEDLASFPYVNGGLFADENIEIPNFNEKIVGLLLKNASEDFNWSEISPTIFGAVFESTLNPETRRSGGMHYTSIENIHKVIDPLFLDELKEELAAIKEIKVEKTRKQRLEEFINKLSTLNFLDPACGSGNFLTETYISLRRLENQALDLIHKGQMLLGFDGVIKVSIGQFYGIEINDFAVTVAKTALWIAESQMMKETEEIVKMNLNFLPLKSYANITEGNALRIDWETICPKDKLSYIMGNPPFVGASNMDKVQKEEIFDIFKAIDNAGNLDYVCAWYKKAMTLMYNTSIKCAFVSTNSICQGEQVSILWKHLLNDCKAIINFAHRTFRWDSEASIKAHVHCVIVGFSAVSDNKKKRLYSSERMQLVDNINGYLLNADNVFIDNFSKPLSNVPKMIRGSSPCDNGNLSFTEDEKNVFIKNNPELAPYIKKYIGSQEFINRKNRYVLWLYGASPNVLRQNKAIFEIAENIKKFRLSSKKSQTKELANTPLLWEANRYNGKDFILIPRVSSEKRKYIPIGFVDGEIIANDACQLVPNATLYHFGILTSNVHNAWMRTVCGRLKSDYRYSNLVYNSFVWCNPSEEQKAKIEQTAQAILDARALYSNCSLADLYDEIAMPSELREAHQANDKAVMQAYGFWGKIKTESECVAELMKMYQKLTRVK